MLQQQKTYNEFKRTYIVYLTYLYFTYKNVKNFFKKSLKCVYNKKKIQNKDYIFRIVVCTNSKTYF